MRGASFYPCTKWNCNILSTYSNEQKYICTPKQTFDENIFDVNYCFIANISKSAITRNIEFSLLLLNPFLEKAQIKIFRKNGINK